METLKSPAQHVQERKAGTVFVHGKGQRKSQAQREREAAEEWRRRWEGCQRELSNMGSSRNSYFATASDAAFMRMKENSMRNGQLKPGYHMQTWTSSTTERISVR